MIKECGIDELRKSGGDLIDRVRLTNERLIVTKNGKPAVMLISWNDSKFIRWSDEAKKMKPFWLCIKDDDKRLFTIVGPMRDDRPWNEAVENAQQEGRRVTCCTVKEGPTDSVMSTFTGYGYTYTPKIIINPPY